MSTPISKCYDAFLSHMDDNDLFYPFSDETEDEFEERLEDTCNQYFRQAIVKFFFSKTSLEIDEVRATFVNDLRPIEIEIIGLLMVKEYYRKKLNFLSRIGYSYSDKDWKNHDKSSQMNQYRQMLKEIDEEINALILRNSYTTNTGSFTSWLD